MPDEQQKPMTERATVADAVAQHTAERQQGIRLDSWRSQIALMRHQLRIAESDAERDRIRRLRERWTAAVAEFNGQPQATGRHSVMPEEAT